MRDQLDVDKEEEIEKVFLFQRVSSPPDRPTEGDSIQPYGDGIPRDLRFFSVHEMHLVSCKQTIAGFDRLISFLIKNLLAVLFAPLTFHVKKVCKSIKTKGGMEILRMGAYFRFSLMSSKELAFEFKGNNPISTPVS